jgi:hypothetical protein
MQYQDVVTFLHEFGHLMHAVLAGQQQWGFDKGSICISDLAAGHNALLAFCELSRRRGSPHGVHPIRLCQNCVKTTSVESNGVLLERKADSPSCCVY